MKLLFSGRAWDCLLALREHGLQRELMPDLDLVMAKPLARDFLKRALENTDSRLAEDKPVSAGFLFAALLWHEVDANWQAELASGKSAVPALVDAINEAKLEKRLAIPNRYGATMREIWQLQPRFEQRVGQRPFRLLEQARFRAGYDFLVLRAECGMVEKELAHWWHEFQYGDDDSRSALIARAASTQSPAGGSSNKRKRRRKPKSQKEATTSGE